MKIERNKIILNGDYMKINITPMRVNVVADGMALCSRLDVKFDGMCASNPQINVPIDMLEDITFNENDNIFNTIHDVICDEDGLVQLNGYAEVRIENECSFFTFIDCGIDGGLDQMIYQTNNVRCLQRFLQCHRQNYEFDFSNCEIK